MRRRRGTMVVLAHPDDETLGGGVHLVREVASGEPVTIVTVTAGAPQELRWALEAGCADRESYAALRQRELEAATALMGLASDRLVSLGAVDQQAIDDAPALAVRLAELDRAHRPARILTHPYEGGHPDHDTCALLTRRLVDALAPADAPALWEMAFYHDDAGTFVPGKFLDVAGAAPAEVTVLDAASRVLKQRMFDCFASQRATLALFPIEAERLRPAPRYDFRERPALTLYYERMGWGHFDDWRSAAARL